MTGKPEVERPGADYRPVPTTARQRCVSGQVSAITVLVTSASKPTAQTSSSRRTLPILSRRLLPLDHLLDPLKGPVNFLARNDQGRRNPDYAVVRFFAEDAFFFQRL